MGVIPLFILAVAVVAVALHLWAKVALRRACRNGATRIHRELTTMFAGEHEFRVVPDEEARQGELPEEADVRAALARAGFRSLGWIEDLTATSVYPHLRSFLECHAADDGRTCVTILRLSGLRLFDLGTRLAGDRFLVTTNAEVNKLEPPPSTEKETLPYGSPFEDLHGRHLERLNEHRPGPSGIRPCRHLTDVIAASRLYSSQASAHRQSVGYLREEELMGMGAGVQREAVARLVWQEFRRLRESGRLAA